MSEPRTQGVTLDAARAYCRQGLLREAEQTLKGLTAEQSLTDRAAVQLLFGNIAYERGDYAQAVEAWKAALTLYASDEGAEHGVEAVVGNLALGEERLERSHELDLE